MSDYQGNIVIKNPATPTGPSTFGRAPGMWKLNEVAYWIKQGVWPNPAIVPDIYFPYVSLLLSSTSLGNANNNLFVDSSGVFNPVSRNGNTTQGSFTPYSTNWSNYFAGGGSYISTPTVTALQMSGDFTWEAWVYPLSLPSAGNYKGFWTQRTFASDIGGPLVVIDSAGNLLLFIADAAATAWSVSGFDTNLDISLNTWQHIALVKSGTTLKLYKNGVAGSSTTHSTAVGTSGNTAIMAGAANGNQGVDGYMSNFRIVKGTAVYTSNFTPSTSALTAISGTSLLTCQSNRFIDNSGNNFTLTAFSDTRVTDFGPFSPAYPGLSYNQSDITNWSGYFDGSGDYLTTTNTNFTGNATVECWLYLNSLANPFQVFGTNNAVSDLKWIGMLVATNGAISGAATAGSGGFYQSATGVITTGQWHHIAWVKNGSNIFVYVNGTQVATCTASAGYAYNATPLYIGRLDGNDAYCPNGYISNLRIVNGTAVYTSTFTPPTSPLTAISGTSLLTLQNAAFTDNSTNNFAITPFGNTTVTGNSPFNTTGFWSNYFTGSAYLSLPVTSSAFTLPGNFTLEAWVYRPASGYVTLFDTRSGGNYTDWVVGVGSSGEVDFVTVGGPGVRITTSERVAANTWTHVACVREGSAVKIYINGVASVNTAIYSATISPASTEGWIGRTKDPLNNSGYISNLRLVKGTAVYTANFTPPTAPLTAISGTSLLTCQNGRFIDNSANAFTITPNNSPQAQPFDPFYTATVASNGGSLYLDGTGDYLTSPTSPAYDFGSSNFTIEGWFYFTNSTANQLQCMYSNYTNFSSAGSIYFGKHSSSNSGCVSAWFSSYSTGSPLLTESTLPPNNAWTHYAMVRNGNTFTLYRNGVSTASASWSGAATAGSCPAFIGVPGDATVGYNYFFPGYMSDFRITKSAVYTAAFTPPTAPLTPSANTTLLLNGMNAGIYDATTINDMETVGNAQVSTVQSKFGGSSVYFDGTGDYLSIPASPNLTFGTGDFTMELWVYSGANGTSTRTMGNGAGAGWSANKWVFATGDATYVNKFIFGCNNANSGAALLYSTTTFNDNTWKYVAITRSGNTWRLFVNGVLEGTATSSASLDGGVSATITVGRSGISGDADWAGYIDDLRLTKGVARYTSNFTPPTQPFPVY